MTSWRGDNNSERPKLPFRPSVSGHVGSTHLPPPATVSNRWCGDGDLGGDGGGGMKNFFRKLHIGEGSGDGASSPPPPPSRKGGSGAGAYHPQTEQGQPSAVSSWLDSVPVRSLPPTPPTPSEAEGSPSASSVGVVVGAEERRQSGAAERRRSQEEDEVEERVIRESSEAEERKRVREKEDDDLEELQLQLVLEMSARDNPEEMEIEVAKQISLGFCPPHSSAAEDLAVRYWNFNALGYDDKISDGFYDLYVTGNGPASITMPSLKELRAQSLSHRFNWEAVLVHRGEDPELMRLEQTAVIMSLEFSGNALVQKLAGLVARHMGGTFFDPESMLMKYQSMIRSLRNTIGSVVVPLGQLKIGLARHRALLFKVLADNLDIPCRLLKGRQYTGSDDGALNIVKFDDGREFIVDLVADPGTLIPSDGSVLSTEFEESSFSNNHHFDKDSATNQPGSSRSLSNSACGSFEYELLDRRSTSSTVGPSDMDGSTTSQTIKSNQPNTMSSFEILTVSTCATENRPITNESTSMDDVSAAKNKERSTTSINSSLPSPSSPEVGSTPAVRRMKVKDISEYMINAAKENPQLAQKIHEVLLENGVVAPPDLFSEDSMEEPKDLIVYDTTGFQSKDEMKKRMNELGSMEYADHGHGLLMPHHAGHELPSKVVPHRAPLDSLKPIEGLGIYHPPDIRDNASFISQYEPSAPLQEVSSQLTKQLPVTAAAVATAAVVASSMVVAAAKSNSDMNFDVPVAAAATVTAAAVVATTAAVSKKYEHVESENDSVEVHQEVERTSDKSSGTESAKSEIALEDVAEFEIQWEEITIGERIGLGSFGEVYRGEWHGTEVAVKKFLQQDFSSDALEEFRTEVRIMKRLRHPNVVLFMGAITRAPNLSIVTEFLPRGSLFRLIHRPNNQLDERRCLRMALDVARGMNYLHNCTPVIVHRDLKSPNLLVDKNWVVKVCDFGLSRMKNNTFLSSRSTAGTAEWMAPEVLRNEPSNEKDPKLRPSFAEIMTALKPLLKNTTSTPAPRQGVQQTGG
ncbi:hypothetical protein GUJ93_ZPchr0002g23247 [Zizania palustris]|uniref:non-specific serine/threonine protein kinase n=1 Tax=Zizania palustris TaxID=103762 RepID=A0A8J5VTE6_ZIZPA|nr:hypothetical protein GUJ93_ZPchr0002g23247 [Zizania palustris]